MHEIRTPEDLIQWLERNAPRPCIRRAVTYGTVVNYGFFSGYGFVVTVKSRVSPTLWVLYVSKVYGVWRYHASTATDIPWGHYEGGKCKLFAGDVPVMCGAAKRGADMLDLPQKRNGLDRIVTRLFRGVGK